MASKTHGESCKFHFQKAHTVHLKNDSFGHTLFRINRTTPLENLRRILHFFFKVTWSRHLRNYCTERLTGAKSTG